MNGKKNAWIPVLAPLLSIVIDQDSPDLVLNDFMAVGFNFHLPLELEDRYGPRKRAYVAEVQGWIDDLEWTSQWELARALALRLSENRAHLVEQRLAGVGWRLDGTQFVPTEISNTDQHVFFPAGAVHDAFVHIRSLFKGASKEIFLIDGYLDSSLFQFLLSTNSPKTCRVLTKARQLPKDFLAETKAFVTQHGFAFSVRSSDVFHDRAIILDGKQVFVLGASIKDAGKRAFNIVPVEAPPMVEGMILYAEQEWSTAQNVF
ncbi:MAG: hypothetical protein WB711_08980 [Terriglobales bacterium]